MLQKIGFFLVMMSALLAGCSKKMENIYSGYGSPVSSGSTVNSNIRLVSVCTGPIIGPSLSGTFPNYPYLYTDHRIWELRLNGRSFNAYGIGDTIVFNPGRYYQSYEGVPASNPFPKVPFAIPDSSRGSDGKVHMQVNYIFSLYQQGNHIRDSVVNAVDTSLSNTAQDLYLYNNQFFAYNASNSGNNFSADPLLIKAFPRAVSVSDPSKFKIRVINLAHAAAFTFTGRGDPLFLPGGGTVTLTGSGYQAISSSLTKVAPGQASDYIELPYGTYQFRVLSENNQQVPFLPAIPATNPTGSLSYFLNTASYASPDNYITNSMTYEPIRTYLPGGIYTIIVYDGLGQDKSSGSLAQPYLESGYRIIQDNTPSANISYSNLQWVNALPGQKGSLTIDGNSMGQLNFGQYSSYKVFTVGQHTVSLQDSAGNALLSKSFQLTAMNNYSIWAYMDQSDRPQISFVSNEMDMTNGGLMASSDFNFAARFLNFCPDAERITFTTSNEQPYSYNTNPLSIYPIGKGSWDASHQNLQFAVPRQDTSYLISPIPYQPAKSSSGINGHINNPFNTYNLFTLNAFISDEDPKAIIPGTAIPSLKILGNPFIIDTTRYPETLSKAYGQSPNVDAGIFSAALIGRINTSDTAQQVRLMVVRHVQ